MKKRMISIALVLALLVQILPTYVFAEDDASDNPLVEAVEPGVQEPGLVVLGEMTDRRGESEKHFRMNDGSFTAVDYGAPVHFTEDDGETWNDIDNTLVLSRDDDELYTAENGDSVRGFASNLQDGRIFTVANGNYSIQMGLASDTDNADGENRNVSASAEISYPDEKNRGNEEMPFAEQVTPEKLRADVLYRNVYDGVDLSYTLYSYNIKETIVLNQPRSSYSFPFTLDAEGLTPVLLEDSSIELRTADGEVIYLIPAPFMTDAAGAESDAVSYALEEADSGSWALTVIADSEWINDEARSFPVAIDPTIIDKVTWSAQGIGVTYVVSGEPSTKHTHHQSLWFGYTPYAGLYEHQIYVGWDALPTVPFGSEVINARLYMGQLDYQAVGPSSMIGEIHAVSSSRPNDYSTNYNWICDLDWNHKPTLDNTVIDYTVMDSTTVSRYIPWDITELVKAWYVQGNTQTRAAGIKLFNVSSYSSSYYATAKFHGYGSSTGPLFVVTYRDLTGIEPYYTYQSLGADRAGSAYISDYTGALTTVTPLVSYASTVNPFSLNLIYNSSYFAESDSLYDTPQQMGYGFFMGSGTRLNLMQKVQYVDLQYELDGNETKRYIKYTDGDGTAHYFAPDEEKQNNEPQGSPTYYYDEDGLGLKIKEYATDYFQMEDDRGNRMFFICGYLTILIDANGNRYDIFFRHSDGTMGSSGYPTYSGDRIDHVEQTNIGESDSIQVASFQYEVVNGQKVLRSITDASGSIYQFNYSGNRLQAIKRKLFDESNYKDYVEYAYSGNGFRMTKLTDCISDFSINLSYLNGRAASFWESVNSGNQVVTGAGATISRLPGERTVYTDWGNDRSYQTNDDILTSYLFDHAARTVNAFTTDKDGKILGASNAVHSGTGDTDKKNNRTLRSAGIGTAGMSLVRNGGFELTETATAWTPIIPSGSGNSALVKSGELARTGSKAFKTIVTGSASQPTGCSKSLGYLTANKTYTLSVYVNTSQATAINSQGIYLKVVDPWNCTWISTHLNYKTDSAIDDGWVRLVFPFTTERNGNHTVYLYNADMTGSVYFDDFQIEEASGPSNVNLLDNGGLLSSSSGWLNESNGTATSETPSGGAIEGTTALKIVGSPNTNKYIHQTVSVNQPVSQTYVLSGWAKANAVPDNVSAENTAPENDTNKQFGLRAVLTYSDNSTEAHYVPFNPDVTDWQFTSLAIVPKKTSGTVSTIKVICAYEKNANTAWFDNLSLVKEVAQTMTYDDDGNLICVNSTGTTPESAAYSNGNLTQMNTGSSGTYNYSYDNKHNLTQASNQVVKEDYTYDSKGNMVASALTKADGTPSPTKTINSSRSYTNGGNLLQSQTNANGYSTSFAYNASLNIMVGVASSSTNAKGTSVTTSLLSDGRISGSWISSYVGVFRTYDAKNQLTTLNRGGYNVTGNDPTPHNQYYNFSYDTFGNTTSISVGSTAPYSLGTYTYAANDGLLTGMSYGNGATVSYTYDNYGRKTQTTSSDGDSYRYRYTGDGQLWQMKDNAGNLLYQYTYDTLGRLIGSSMHSGSTLTLRTQHQYDNANRLARQVWALSGKTYQEGYAYDSHGRLTQKQLTLPGNTSANIFLNYDELSRLSAVTSPVYDIYYNYLAAQNGTGTTNAVHQFSINPRTTNANRYKQLFFRYSYDELGNIASAETITQNSTLSDAVYYSYDNQSQLTSAASSANGTWYYQYDAYGNIRNTYHGTDYISYTYGNSNWLDLLTAVSGTKNGVSFSGSYSYDGAGNPTSFYNIGDGTSWTMTWRNGRELATAVNGTHSVSYDYDVNGLRTYKIVDGVRHDYIYASGQLLRESYTQSGTAYTLDFVYDHSGRPYMLNLTTTVSGASTTTPYYYLLNLQGDVVEIVNASEVPVADYSYDAYGNILSATGSLASVNPLRYRGYYYDTETGFYYLQSRYYDPIVKRFLNADSYGSTGQGFLGYNMFAYCNNNPVNCVDPSGQFCISSIIEEIKNQIEKKLQSEKKKREDLDNLILKYATIRKDGFQIDIATDTDAWDSAIKAYGIQQSYDYISNQLCNQYSSKYVESFLFSNDCVSYEIEYHVDAYMCVTGHDGYNRNITTYAYSNDSLKLHCCSIDISTNDVFDVKQSTIFGYMNGIRVEYQYTSKDPFYSARIVQRII
jgi:RHS repeat-associated protein